MEKNYFSGPFAPMCELFVAQKRATGIKYDQQAIVLRMFDNFCKAFEITNYEITEEIAIAWAEKRPNEKEITRHNRIAEMHRFSLFLCAQGYVSYLVPTLPKTGEKHYPYIFSKEEICRIIASADHLEPTNISPDRHLVYPCLIRVLYGCGTRISETLNLLNKDVDLENGIFHIQHSKNDGERLVPMSAPLRKYCLDYSNKVHRGTDGSKPFFSTRDGGFYSRSTVGKEFRSLLWDAGIPYRGKDEGPRLHDLRHTFVCHRLKEWAEAGISLHTKLSVLSKYLGHSSIRATEWYLHLTAEIYPHIRSLCQEGMNDSYLSILREFKEAELYE